MNCAEFPWFKSCASEINLWVDTAGANKSHSNSIKGSYSKVRFLHFLVPVIYTPNALFVIRTPNSSKR